ncbi:MAG: ubiquitin-like domain-containing protein, partial [Chloroflexota bacterium]
MSIDPNSSDSYQPVPISPVGKSRSTKRVIWIILAGIVLTMACMAVCAAVLALNLMHPSPSKPATVVVAGIGYQVQTHSETVGDLLREFSIPLNTGDTVSPAPESTIAAGLVVRVDRARQVTVTVDGNVQPVQTVFTNPTDILRAAGVSVSAKDRVLVDGTLTQMNDLLVWPVPVSNITIQRAIPVQIVDGTQTITVQTTAPTVAEALYEAGTTLYLA